MSYSYFNILYFTVKNLSSESSLIYKGKLTAINLNYYTFPYIILSGIFVRIDQIGFYFRYDNYFASYSTMSNLVSLTL